MLQARLIDGECPGAYRAAAADPAGKGKAALLVTCPEKGLLLRYEAPGWTRSTVGSGLRPGLVDVAAYDLDSDGEPEFAVLDEFWMEPSDTGGRVLWLDRPAAREEEWRIHVIDTVPTAHRLLWARLGANPARKELVVAPLLAPGVTLKNPRERGAELYYYRIPDDPRESPWDLYRHRIDKDLPLLNGLHVRDIDADGRDEVLTASAAGTILYRAIPEDGSLRFERRYLSAKESSEVFWSPRGPRGKPMVATIEPWRGHQVCVYLPPPSGRGMWRRLPIDDTLADGQTLLCADLDGDGRDEILSGWRGHGGGLALYRMTDTEGLRWEKQSVEAGFPCTGLALLPRPGARPGILAVGGRSVKLFESAR